jgi:hypothetical protein
MARKIKFPLEMEGKVKVRTLEGLRENFSMGSTLGYISNGKLVTWLRDRYIDNIADEIEELDINDSNLSKKICEILSVKYKESFEADLKRFRERNRKLKMLKRYTDENKYDGIIDNVAFSQDELYYLLDEGEITIYLCGERFTIPISKEGITYIGINNPIAVIESKEEVDWGEKNISISNIKYDSKYEEILNKKTKEQTKAKSSIGGYCNNTYINFMLSKEDKINSENLYNKISNIINNLHYDIDKDIVNLKKQLEDIGIAGIAEKYIDSL